MWYFFVLKMLLLYTSSLDISRLFYKMLFDIVYLNNI